MSKATYLVLILLYICSTFHDASARMTEKQLVAAVKLVRNMCQGKTKASNEDIEKMHKGDFNVEANAGCYMWCSLNMYKLMDKDNHFDRKAAEVQLHQLPVALQDYVTICIDKCEHAATNLDDKCAAAMEYTKCIFFCDPEKYFLP